MPRIPHVFLMHIDKAASLVSPTCLCPSFRRSEDDSCLSTRARTIKYQYVVAMLPYWKVAKLNGYR